MRSMPYTSFTPRMTVEIPDTHPWYQWLIEYMDSGKHPPGLFPYIPIELGGVVQNYAVEHVDGPSFSTRDSLDDETVMYVTVVLKQRGRPSPVHHLAAVGHPEGA